MNNERSKKSTKAGVGGSRRGCAQCGILSKAMKYRRAKAGEEKQKYVGKVCKK